MRIRYAVPVIVIALLAILSALFWYRSPAIAPTLNGEHAADLPSVGPEPSAPLPDDAVVPDPEPADEPAETAMEKVIAPRVQYFPPPTRDLTGSTLGQQRIRDTKDIGDIYQLYFHLPSFSLFMAVIEPDGLRAIWRLDQYGEAERVFAANAQRGEIRLFGDSKGVMYVQYNNPSGTVRTDDQFRSWHDVNGAVGLFWDIADDGYKTVYATLHDYNRAVLLRSPDDGFSWEPWIDFQEVFSEDAVRYDPEDPRYRLRHLHSVIHNDRNGDLVVGMGDVARYTVVTHDGGKTWEKIWDEGFTAHALVSGGNRFLLGPDKLRGPGIAIYDAQAGTVKEVFNPGAHGFAGYSYSIINSGEAYYAAFHTESNEVEEVVPKSGIVVSPDAETWYPFLEWGPLGHNARTDIWLAESPGAIYASVNGALYSFRPLDRDWFADKTPFPGE